MSRFRCTLLPLLGIGVFLSFILVAPAMATPATSLGRAYRTFEQGDFAKALEQAKRIPIGKLRNPDYLLYLLGQSHYFEGHYDEALGRFETLRKISSSRFNDLARWRSADCLFQLEQFAEAAKRYRGLIANEVGGGEAAIAQFRLAEIADKSGNTAVAIRHYRDFLRKYAGHSLGVKADNRLVALGAGGIAELSAGERIDRAIDLIDAKKWEIALQELSELDTESMDETTLRNYKFWISMSMFKRRRHYEKAGRTFLSIYKEMGPRAAEALFHGARAMSRADYDKMAIKWYQVLVTDYPNSKWAAEAQFLSGWLEFNMGNYRSALAPLERLFKRYPRSSFAAEAPWYQGMSHYLMAEFSKAIPYFARVEKMGGKEIGGKGMYWRARSLQQMGELPAAHAIFRDLNTQYPFSWYALLGRSHLKAAGVSIGPFGDNKRSSRDAPELDRALNRGILRDPQLQRVEELVAAGLRAEAAVELRRVERSFLRKYARKKPAAMAVLLETYRRVGNYNRPWMLATVHGGRRALDAPPFGSALRWWKHAYPLAFRKLVERYRKLSGFPEYYLYTIMRKESGFDPHIHSYADAQGLLQMIPPTTRRVVKQLGIPYTEDLLFNPERNIQSGSWYIGRLLRKFRYQIPIGAGSFNSGPGAVMRWLKKDGHRPIDEFVELLSYRQTRKYMKRTTETYARYKYLYDKVVYEQPLTVNPDFAKDNITY